MNKLIQQCYQRMGIGLQLLKRTWTYYEIHVVVGFYKCLEVFLLEGSSGLQSILSSVFPLVWCHALRALCSEDAGPSETGRASKIYTRRQEFYLVDCMSKDITPTNQYRQTDISIDR